MAENFIRKTDLADACAKSGLNFNLLSLRSSYNPDLKLGGAHWYPVSMFGGNAN